MSKSFFNRSSEKETTTAPAISVSKTVEIETQPKVFLQKTFSTIHDESKVDGWHVIELRYNEKTGDVSPTFEIIATYPDRDSAIERFKVEIVRANLLG
jgi:hypothetical protein